MSRQRQWPDRGESEPAKILSYKQSYHQENGSVAKDKVTVTLDQEVLTAADADAKAPGLNRSELVEQALRHEHLRIALKSYTTATVPALNIDDYAQKIYQATRAAGL